jgi:ribosomal protein L11 methyltransferase
MIEQAEAAEAALQLVRMQCPVGLSAHELSEALLEMGAAYVCVSDGAAGTAAEEPLFAEHKPGSTKFEYEIQTWTQLTEARQLWSNASLEVGFAPSADVEGTLLAAAAISGLSSLPRFSISALAQRDWVSDVQSSWPPIHLPGCLTIRFPWHKDADVAAARASAATAADDVELMLHPGMAFGTGEHATTQLCCLAIRRLLGDDSSNHLWGKGQSAVVSTCMQGDDVSNHLSLGTLGDDSSAFRGSALLDYGSGSGVLAFAALRFGARRAVGVEIDPDALAVSVVNAEMNGLAADFDAFLPSAEPSAQYPIVVANILAGTIIELRALLRARVAPGGKLLLSGIFGPEQAARVQAAFTDLEAAVGTAEGPALGLFEVVYKDGWALLEATRAK